MALRWCRAVQADNAPADSAAWQRVRRRLAREPPVDNGLERDYERKSVCTVCALSVRSKRTFANTHETESEDLSVFRTLSERCRTSAQYHKLGVTGSSPVPPISNKRSPRCLNPAFTGA